MGRNVTVRIRNPNFDPHGGSPNPRAAAQAAPAPPPKKPPPRKFALKADDSPAYRLRSQMYLNPEHASPDGNEQCIRQGWRRRTDFRGTGMESNAHGADAWTPPGMAWYRWRLLRNHICAEKIAFYWEELARVTREVRLKRLREQEAKAAAAKGWQLTLTGQAKAKAQAEKDAAEKARVAALAEREAADKAARRARRLAQRLYREQMVRQAEAQWQEEREMGWQSSTYKPVPSRYKGLLPKTAEPWVRDAITYLAKTGSLERGLNREEAYNDESVLDSNNPDASRRYVSRTTSTGLTRRAGQPAWDETTYRNTPHALRGMRLLPYHREPWAVDEQVYNHDTLRDTTDEERAGGGALDLGSISHATRSKAGQVDRASFYQPSWEKWSASLSA